LLLLLLLLEMVTMRRVIVGDHYWQAVCAIACHPDVTQKNNDMCTRIFYMPTTHASSQQLR
jgi:hypothetical protein